MSQPSLPGLEPPKRQRRAQRVLMRLHDAGEHNYREWRCSACELRVQVHHVEDPPNAYRWPCPRCPQPWTDAGDRFAHVFAYPLGTGAPTSVEAVQSRCSQCSDGYTAQAADSAGDSPGLCSQCRDSAHIRGCARA